MTPNPNKESTTLIPICSTIKCFDTWVSPLIVDLCEIETEETIRNTKIYMVRL